jgi:hypothetical protein
MKREGHTPSWSPDKKISWAASLLVVLLANWAVIFLESIEVIHLRGKGLFWVGTAVGLALAGILNWLRPRYDQAGRFWRPIYRFLLEQLPPPD